MTKVMQKTKNMLENAKHEVRSMRQEREIIIATYDAKIIGKQEKVDMLEKVIEMIRVENK